MDGCLDSDELVAMLDGALPPDRTELVVTHVDTCAACAEVLAGLGAFAGADRSVGRYRLEAVLGAGAMGIVYSAWDPELERRVAIKLVRPERSDAAARARMLREARALAKISHPNVIAVHDVGEHRGEVFVATELVHGETLATWCAGKPDAQILDAWIQAARGLAAAHAGGVVHRDVKPANVLVGRDGRVRIGDFGLARHDGLSEEERLDRAPAPSSRASTIAGTPAYMAPEQGRGLIDARSDQYALCVGLAESLTGRRAGPDARPELTPPALAAAVGRGLRARPSERFPTMAALVAALEAARAPAPAVTARRRLVPIVAAGSAVALAAVALAVAVRGGPTERACVVATAGETWGPVQRAALAPRLPATATQRLDRMLAAWTASAADVCAATTPRELRAARTLCLEGQRAQIADLLAAWTADPPGDPSYAMHAFERLPALSACSTAALVHRATPPPARLGEEAALRVWLAAARRADDLGQVRAIAERARSLDAAFAVEALTALAFLEERAAATATLREALAIAEAAHDDHAQVEAAVALLALLGADATAEATAVADRARPALRRLDDPELEALLEFRLADVWHAAGNHDEAIGGYARAHRLAVVAWGEADLLSVIAQHRLAGSYLGRDPDDAQGRALAREAGAQLEAYGVAITGATDPASIIAATLALVAQARTHGEATPELEFHAEMNLAAAYVLLDDDAHALEHYRAAIAVGERLQLRDAQLALALSQAAAIVMDTDPGAALLYARRAVALAEAMQLDTELGTALTHLGRGLLETGDIAGARAALERALAIREKLREPGRFRGNTRFLYARALWDVDPRGAVANAVAGRLDIETDVKSLPHDTGSDHIRRSQRKNLEQIDRWLATHRAR